MIGIYKLVNNINKKVYIGQSLNIERRYGEHLRSAQPEKYSCKNERDSKTPIHLAMQKYGVKNFTLVVLCECTQEELNEMERYYIKFYHSNDKKYGYNITEGGQDNFALKRAQHSQAKLSEKNIADIKKMLINNICTNQEIAKRFNVSPATISLINNGKIWNEENEQYPLRKKEIKQQGSNNNNAQVNEEIVMMIRQDYVDLSFAEIVDKYNQYTKSCLRSIIYGESWKHLPIYKKKNKTWIEPCIDYSQSLK